MLRGLRVALLALAAALILPGGFSPKLASGQANSFQGSTVSTPGPVALHAGLVIVRGRSNGAANFVVSLVTQDPGATVANSFNNRYLMIDSVGRYDGAAATLLTQDGSYFLEVSQASGQFQLTVEQPSPATVQPVSQTSFSGKQQQVTSPFMLAPGSYMVTATNDSTALRVRLYFIDDLGGSAIVSPLTGFYGDELMDTTIPPGLLSVPVDIPAAGMKPDGTPINGTFMFYVYAEGTGPGSWTVSVR